MRAAFPVLMAAMAWSRLVAADGAELPAGVLAHLVSKVPGYDYGFRARVAAPVVVLILTDPEQPESVRAATLLEAALGRENSIAGLPHRELIHAFQDGASLAAEVKRRQVSIVYVTSGLSERLDAICGTLQPFGVLTMTAVPEYVERCVLVGFQLLAGRPKILIHLTHAVQSGVRFRSELLELARVYR